MNENKSKSFRKNRKIEEMKQKFRYLYEDDFYSLKSFDKNVKFHNSAANLIDEEAYFNKSFKKSHHRPKSAFNVQTTLN